MILGLDVSTSTIGISVFSTDGSLLQLTHLKPIIKPKPNCNYQYLYEKSVLFGDFLRKKFNKGEITRVIVEEPLVSSSNIKTATILNLFCGMVYHQIYNALEVYPNYIHINDARRYALPEILGENKKGKSVLWGSIPNQIKKIPISKYRKDIILSQVAQRYPDVVWLLNNNYTVDKKNYDRADSIVTVLGYMAMHGYWENKKIGDIQNTIEFIEKNIEYQEFVRDITSNSALLPDEKRDLKIQYLTENFQINEHINVPV